MQRHQWPALLRYAHAAAFSLLPLLLVTGALIYFPSTHVALIRYLPVIVGLHDGAGVAFALLLFLPLLAVLPERRFAWPDWLVSLGVGAACGVTGVILWRIGWFPVTWRSNAFMLHGATAIALGVWAVVHAARHIIRGAVRRDLLPVELRAGVGRREFLRAAGGGAAVALLASASLDTIVRVLQYAGTGSSLGAGGWQIYTVTGQIPAIDASTYRLQVDGLVGQPRSFSLAEIQALEDTQEVDTFQCVTGWVVPNVAWHGVDLNTLLNACGGSSGSYLTFYSADGAYVDSLSASQATGDGTLLVYGMDSAPLPSEHGGPLRLIVPAMYGYKSVKWLQRITVSDKQVVGYWEQRGYKVDAYLPGGGAPGANLRS
ncbi:MAG TPA: molybdopterin-dependent oxidoreductase [Bacillota bacterium]|nr:molybdopterin-dependent oxidoreductase [Bacillota bacterium]